MPNDDRSFIERSDAITSKLYGDPMSVERIVDHFALYGLRKRSAALEDFDAELRSEIDLSPNTLRRRAQLIELRRKMDGVHAALRDAGR